MNHPHDSLDPAAPAGHARETPAPERIPLGSRDHIRETVARARAAARVARERTAHSREVLARADAVADASERAVEASLALRAQLRASVTAYVRHLRADGAPPERMLVLVKAAVSESAPPELDPVEAHALMEDVVRWSVEAYYHAA
nr:hypothetical protein [uncultured bacterium]